MSPKFIVQDLIFFLLGEMQKTPSIAPTFDRLQDSQEVWRRLLFCILSSQVRVSTAARALNELENKIYFFEDKLPTTAVYLKAKELLADKAVGYRFPDTRSRQIANSWFAFGQIESEIYEFLDSFNSETQARSAVQSIFPGLGLKQSSMFLRDIGFSDRLCVIDTHILWYCSEVHGQDIRINSPRRYQELENFLIDQSEHHGVSPSLFDSVLWVAVKTMKARQCTMRSA
jgi:N-glycosylase/DNA lyase